MAGGDEICVNSKPLQGLIFDGTMAKLRFMYSKQN